METKNINIFNIYENAETAKFVGHDDTHSFLLGIEHSCLQI